jgi:type I restriction enzyme S subunit
MMVANGETWEKRKVEELAEFITVGFVGSMSSLFVEEGVPLLRGQNIHPYTLDLTNLKYISLETHRKWKKSALKPGDVVIVRVGYPGTACVIPEGIGELNAASLVIVRPSPALLDARYLCYVINSPWGKAQIAGRLVGSAQQVFNTQTAAELEIPAPPLPVQCRIASILSAYDDLIKNSQRRIKILESMARALYREWFVEFRFPGHESATFSSTAAGEVPLGWSLQALSEICEGNNGIQTGPFGSQLHESDYSPEGVPVVMPKDLINYRIRTDSIARIPEDIAERLGRHRMRPGDIVYGRRGDIGRRAYVMSHQAGWLCGTGCLRIRPSRDAVDGWFLFNYLGQEDVVGLIRGRAQGVTMPNLNTGILSSVPILLPPRTLQEQFAHLTFPMASAIEMLTAKIENLRRTRELLLPRLLSGSIQPSEQQA